MLKIRFRYEQLLNSLDYRTAPNLRHFFFFFISMPPNKIWGIIKSDRLSVRSFVRLSVRLSVRSIFFKGMPFELYIYLGAFVTYCDPILVFTYNWWSYWQMIIVYESIFESAVTKNPKKRTRLRFQLINSHNLLKDTLNLLKYALLV